MGNVTIKKKVIRVVLCVSLTSLILMSAVSFFGMDAVKKEAFETSVRLGDLAAHNSREALISQQRDELLSIARDSALLVDEKLDNIRRQVRAAGALLTELYADPAGAPRREVSPPDPSQAGKIISQVLYAEGADPAELADEVGLIGSISGTLEQMTAMGRGITTMQIGTESGFIVQADDTPQVKPDYLDPRTRGWYTLAKGRGEPVWTDVMDDAYGRGLGIVCAMPVYDGEHRFRAVAAAGALLDDINRNIMETKIGESGYVFVLNESGQVILSPMIRKDENGGVIREDFLESENPQLRAAARLMMEGGSGVTDLKLPDGAGREVYMAYTPLNTLPWFIGAVIDVEEVVAPAAESERVIAASAQAAAATVNRYIGMIFLLFAIVLSISVALTFIFGNVFTERLVRPLDQLTAGVREISAGNLAAQITIDTGDEIQVLAGAFNAMTTELAEYMANLTRVTADKERIATELSVATQIQTSMLPCIFPAFPERSEFDIFASMHAAKEVGGDFYDFFLIDHARLAVVMADVSGKGVPAALFMVIAKTLIKNHAQIGLAPARVFETVNDQLCESNDAGMFVTAFMGILEIETGKFTYANAGHNPPLLSREGRPFEWLETAPGFVLAGMEGISFTEREIMLHEGDRLFLYTDGVTEALNQEQDLYTERRLLQFFNSGVMDQKSVEEILEAESGDIRRFASGAAQADDITMLVLKINGRHDNDGDDGGSDSGKPGTGHGLYQ